jgi:hypothetical protein
MARLNSILALACLLPMSGIAQHISSGPIMRTIGGGTAPTPPDNTLIIHYVFSEGSGTTIADSSGNGYNGSLSGATWVTGKSGSGFALQFDGSNDYAQTASITFSTNIVTVCGWVYWNAFANDDDFLWEHTTDYSVSAGRFVFDANESSGFAFAAIRGSAQYRAEKISRWSAATWTHLAVVYDNSTTTGDVRFYVNGTDTSSTISINNKGGTNTCATAAVYLFSRAGSALFGAGRIDDFRIYGGELSAGEIAYVRDDPQ